MLFASIMKTLVIIAAILLGCVLLVECRSWSGVSAWFTRFSGRGGRGRGSMARTSL